MNYEPIKKANGNEELINAILKHCKNKKKEDKYSISYMVGMMDFSRGIFAPYGTREEILISFEKLIRSPKIDRLNNGYCLTEVFTKFQ